MSAGFEVTPQAVRAAGGAADGAVSALRAVDCGSEVGRLAATLPGGDSATAAGRYASWWGEDFGWWCDGASKHARNLVEAADDYDRNEQASADLLTPHPGPR